MISLRGRGFRRRRLNAGQQDHRCGTIRFERLFSCVWVVVVTLCDNISADHDFANFLAILLDLVCHIIGAFFNDFEIMTSEECVTLTSHELEDFGSR